MYVCRSQNLLSKLAETLLRGKEQLYLRGWGLLCETTSVKRMAGNRISGIILGTLESMSYMK
jgi:hypothetical protein